LGKRWSVLLLLSAVVVGACGPSATPPSATTGATSTAAAVATASAAAQALNLRLNTSFPAADGQTKAVERLAATLKDKTAGAVNITVFPGDALASSTNAALSISRGTYDLDMRAAVFYEGILPAFQLLSAPFSGLTGDKVLELLAPGREARKIIDDQLAKKNVKLLSMWSLGWPGIVSMEPLNTVESFRGKKIRMASVFIGADVLRKHGAEVVLMSGAEAVDALNRRLIDGGTTGPTAMRSRGYHNFAKYWQMWGVDAAPAILTVNLDVYNKLSPANQTLLVATAEQMGRELNQAVLRTDIDALSESIKKGVTQLPVAQKEIDTLAADARPLLEKFARETEPSDVHTRLLQLLLGN
jgi:TRAP-type C4-dicarboxylate transport system substrate-binding protein